MKKLFYLLMLAGLVVFAGCSSNSNSGAKKFLGKWKEKSGNEVTIIVKGKGNTYNALSPGAAGSKWENDTTYYKGFKYDPDKDVLLRDKGSIMEIVYNNDSSTIQPFVNHMPATDPQKKVK